MQRKVAITGASGFIGSELVKFLREERMLVVEISRDNILDENEYNVVDTIIHCAGIAHKTAEPDALRKANTELTVSLANIAKNAGVKRFVFLSSINVVAGSKSVLFEDSPQQSRDPYGYSKACAETELLKMNGIVITILRPTLVYGENAPGNLRLLMKICSLPIPLPFALVKNRRTLVSITNLVSAVFCVIDTSAESVDHKVFHVCDDTNMSTKEMISKSRAAMMVKQRLLPVPPVLLKIALFVLRRHKMSDQLFGDLIIDCSNLKDIGWSARNSNDFTAMAKSYHRDQK